jgi:hypothetical protein
LAWSETTAACAVFSAFCAVAIAAWALTSVAAFWTPVRSCWAWAALTLVNCPDFVGGS